MSACMPPPTEKTSAKLSQLSVAEFVVCRLQQIDRTQRPRSAMSLAFNCC